MNTKKKRLLVVCAVLLCLLIALIILLCLNRNTDEENVPADPMQHSHTFAEEWHSNETDHWQACSCGTKSDAFSHKFDEWVVTKEATEQEAGSKQRACTVCGYLEIVSLPTLSHEHAYNDSWKSNGTDHWHECVCGNKADSSAHKYGNWTITKEASEAKEGEQSRRCEICGYLDSKKIPGLSHSHKFDKENSNETSHWAECSCGEKADVNAHTFDEWIVTKEATETENGSRYHICTVCGYKETESIPKLPHNHTYGDWQQNSSSHWKECRCGEKSGVGTHSFGQWVVTKEATEEEEGSRYHICTVCGYKGTESIPKLPHAHAYGDWKNNSSSHWNECRCGEKINVGEHSFGQWVVTKEATEIEEGSRYRVCPVCGYTETESIAKLPHSHAYGDWKQNSSSHWRECRCGEKGNEGSHSFGSWTVIQESTESLEGVRRRICLVCGYTQTENTPKKLRITSQTTSYAVPTISGTYPQEEISVTVAGGGGSYYYQWQQKVGSSWQNVKGSGAILFMSPNTRGEYSYRCIVSDADGNSVTSNTCTITVFNSPTLEYSRSVSARTFSTATISVKMTKDSLDPNYYTIRWAKLLSNESGAMFVWDDDKYSGTKTLTLKINTGAAETAYYYCRLEPSSSRFRITTDTITLTVR